VLSGIRTWIAAAGSEPTTDSPYRGGTYLEFTFSEPIVAVGAERGDDPSAPGNPLDGISRPSLKELSNYTFAVGLNTEYLSSTVLLSGGKRADATPLINLPVTTTDFGKAGDTELGKEFKLIDSPENRVRFDIVALNRVRLHVPNPDLFYRLNAGAIMARVEGVRDPAQNAIPAALADKLESQPRGVISYPAAP
jgi:hypothetical protein